VVAVVTQLRSDRIAYPIPATTTRFARFAFVGDAVAGKQRGGA
jgi:hypothetical protein